MECSASVGLQEDGPRCSMSQVRREEGGERREEEGFCLHRLLGATTRHSIGERSIMTLLWYNLLVKWCVGWTLLWTSLCITVFSLLRSEWHRLVCLLAVLGVRDSTPTPQDILQRAHTH